MDCPHCGTPHAAAARFCARCGTPLHPHTNRSNHFAANPDEPVRALALLSTLLPHMSGRRHHLYRNGCCSALLVAFVAAGFGVLSIALIVPAVALPAVVLVYLHDHHIWRNEPLVIIGGGFVLALVLGIVVGTAREALGRDVVVARTGRSPAARQRDRPTRHRHPVASVRGRHDRPARRDVTAELQAPARRGEHVHAVGRGSVSRRERRRAARRVHRRQLGLHRPGTRRLHRADPRFPAADRLRERGGPHRACECGARTRTR